MFPKLNVCVPVCTLAKPSSTRQPPHRIASHRTAPHQTALQVVIDIYNGHRRKLVYRRLRCCCEIITCKMLWPEVGAVRVHTCISCQLMLENFNLKIVEIVAHGQFCTNLLCFFAPTQFSKLDKFKTFPLLGWSINAK